PAATRPREDRGVETAAGPRGKLREARACRVGRSRDPRRAVVARLLGRAVIGERNARFQRPNPRRSAKIAGSPRSRIRRCVSSSRYVERWNVAVPAATSITAYAARGSPSRGWPTLPGLRTARGARGEGGSYDTRPGGRTLPGR